MVAVVVQVLPDAGVRQEGGALGPTVWMESRLKACSANPVNWLRHDMTDLKGKSGKAMTSLGRLVFMLRYMLECMGLPCSSWPVSGT